MEETSEKGAEMADNASQTQAAPRDQPVRVLAEQEVAALMLDVSADSIITEELSARLVKSPDRFNEERFDFSGLSDGLLDLSDLPDVHVPEIIPRTPRQNQQTAAAAAAAAAAAGARNSRAHPLLGSGACAARAAAAAPDIVPSRQEGVGVRRGRAGRRRHRQPKHLACPFPAGTPGCC